MNDHNLTVPSNLSARWILSSSQQRPIHKNGKVVRMQQDSELEEG